jgi:NADH-quinone oxidoreductase subunit G
MPRFTLDGRELTVPPGTTILQAALSRGKEIPHFCYHPGLSIAGNCRICLVEVEKAPKLVIGCMFQVQEGMVAHTESPRVLAARRAVMEFLLINHPLDCPICDQAGECKLQDHAVEHGPGRSRYTEPKLALAKAVDIGRHVMLDQERCIQCSRCTRFCDEVTHTGELAFFQRGERSMIGIYPGRRLDNPYSGNVVDICPVGALTLKEFRFHTRVWYLKNTPSICAGCARGCNVMVSTGTQRELMTTLGQQDERIKRIVPRVNTGVNGHWICDEGRLSYLRLDAAPRLSGAAAPLGKPLDYEEAVRRAGEALGGAAAAGRLGLVVSPRLTSETLFAWRLAARGARIGVQPIERGRDDELLIRRDRGANSRGAEWILGDGATPAAEVLAAAGRGELDVVVVLGDALDPGDTADPGAASRARVIYVGPFEDAAARRAELLLPAAAWSEEDGTLVNFEGRIQRVRRVHVPRGERRPGWRVAADVGLAAGPTMPAWSSAADVLASLAAEVPMYDGLDEERIGLLGVPGAAAAPVGRS